jgi:carboxyl-terminal processing protease
VPGGPAAKSNHLKPDDKITGGGRTTARSWMSLAGVSRRGRAHQGPKGSKVKLEIQRGKGATAKTELVELVRDKVRLEDRAAKSR